jgi:polar amino acid transport system substrate-binding protein
MKALLFSIALTFNLSTFAKKYIVGVEATTFLPYSDYKNGEYTGVFKDILKEFAKQEEIEFDFRALPIKRLYASFLSDKLDFKIPSHPIWQSEAKKKRGLKFTYSDPVITYIDGVMVKNKGYTLDKISNISTMAGFTVPQELKERVKKKKLTLKENNTFKGLLTQTILGRNQACFTNITVGKYYLTKVFNTPNALIYDESLPHVKDHYHMSTTKHPELITKFNKFLKTSKKYQAIIKKLEI